MCISILSTAHPNYRVIIINNRDEYLSRPTSPANWWPDPHTHVLGARDLARPVHGTWLGITTHGRLAVLMNCLETNSARAVGVRSRGDIINSWLTSSSIDGGQEQEQAQSVEEFVDELTESEELYTVGGFNLLLGDVTEPESKALAIVSNRGAGAKIRRVGEEPGHTIALSNMTFRDDDHEQPWRKISLGEEVTAQAIEASLRRYEDEDALVNRLFDVLCTDTLPRLPGETRSEAYLPLFKESIFIPVIGKAVPAHVEHPHKEYEDMDWKERMPDPSYLEGLYGTQTQTVVLIAHDGRVRYVARTLYDEHGHPLSPDERDRCFEFQVMP